MKRKKTQLSALHDTSGCVAGGSFEPSPFNVIYSAPAICVLGFLYPIGTENVM